MVNRKAQTIKVSGGGDYSKVAERLKLFRADHPKGKHESGYEVDVDSSLVFTVWLWKDKTDLIDLMKAGVTDKEVLRSSSDANGNARGAIGSKDKDFEKLETIALGRALANLGYLASGEIASSEEMEKFQEYQDEQVQDAIDSLNDCTNLDDLKGCFLSLGTFMANPSIIEAKDTKKAELTNADKQD